MNGVMWLIKPMQAAMHDIQKYSVKYVSLSVFDLDPPGAKFTIRNVCKFSS